MIISILQLSKLKSGKQAAGLLIASQASTPIGRLLSWCHCPSVALENWLDSTSLWWSLAGEPLPDLGWQWVQERVNSDGQTRHEASQWRAVVSFPHQPGWHWTTTLLCRTSNPMRSWPQLSKGEAKQGSRAKTHLRWASSTHSNAQTNESLRTQSSPGIMAAKILVWKSVKGS